MEKNQIIIVAFFMLLVSNFLLPVLLGSFEIGFDVPLFGHVTLFSPEELFGAYSFILGGTLTLIIVYFMWQERRQKT